MSKQLTLNEGGVSVPDAAVIVGLSRYMVNYWISKDILEPAQKNPVGMKREIFVLDLFNLVQLNVIKNFALMLGAEAKKVFKVTKKEDFKDAFKKNQIYVVTTDKTKITSSKIKRRMEAELIGRTGTHFSVDNIKEIESKMGEYTQMYLINIPKIVEEIKESAEIYFEIKEGE